MRCGFCGSAASRERPMLSVGGLRLCEDCATLAAGFYEGRAVSVPLPTRPGWHPAGPYPDPEALRASDPGALTREVALLREVIAPIERFLRGAEAAIAGGSPETVAIAVGRHVHRTAVALGEGTSVTGVSFLAGDPYGRDSIPAYGLYLDTCWDPPWPHEHVDWPDFGVPDAPDALAAVLEGVLGRARQGELVEVGCLGGHGRTGTALACLAVLTGTPAETAVDWVRANYCPDAVETEEQRAFVLRFGDR